MPNRAAGGAARPDVPAGGPSTHPSAFIGRRRELATVVGALADPPVLVLVEGEPGIGKTRLVRECLDNPDLRELAVLEMVCPPLREPFPLGPIADAIHRTRARAAELPLSPLGGALRPLFPEWAGELPPAPEPLDDPKSTRHRLFRALAELLEQMGVAVLLVEDAHWADPVTLELLIMLATAGRDSFRLVATYRPADVPADSPLLRLTSRSSNQPRHVRVAPEPFSRAETRALVASMFASDRVADDFVAFLHERTGGVPLALEESLWLLRDRGDIMRRDGEWTRRRAVEELQVPPTVRDSVLERVHRLRPAARRVLEAAAVLAGPADEALLASAAGLGERATRRGLAAALTSGLLREAGVGRFVLRHALASRAVEEAVPASERRRLHQQAGQALSERANPSPAQLSRHFQEAGDIPRWSRYAEAAADLALESGDDRAAVATLLDLLRATGPAPDQRDRLAHKLGEAAAGGVAALGSLAEQVTAALHQVLARDDGSADRRAEIRLPLGRLLLQLGEFDDGYRQLEAAVAGLEHQPVLAGRAMMSLSFPRGTDWPAARHLEWLERGTRLLSRVPPGPDRVSLAVDRATALLFLGEEAGWQAAAEIGEDAPGLPERRQVARMLMNAGHLAIAWGRYHHARSRLEAAVPLMRATGYERLLNSASLTMAYLDWSTGAWEGLAERVAGQHGGEDTLPEADLEAGLILALLDLAGGRHDVAARRLEEIQAGATRRGLIDVRMLPAAALGRLHLADGAPAVAVEVTGPGIDMIARKSLWLWATDIAPVHVEALAGIGEAATARALVAEFAAGLSGREAPAPAAAVLACRAVLAEADGDLSEADGRYAAAARAWSALPRPYEASLAVERQGRVLLAPGAEERALAALRTAQQRLSTLGARWDADRVARLLRDHGIEVARVWRGGRRGYGDRLSPREQDVVRLVARGLTNRQVAERLFLSPRTVDRHLSAAMHKVGVGSRTALAVAAADRGLLVRADGSRKRSGAAGPETPPGAAGPETPPGGTGREALSGAADQSTP
jgi:DNA-binding CsgD family transcriptional regulator